MIVDQEAVLYINSLIARAEKAECERDEARAEVERLREDDKAVLRREADEACKMVTRIEQEAYRIKLEARAEVATAAKYCDELAETIRMHIAREIELEAEVAELRADYDRVVTDLRRCASEPYEHAPERAAAFRRGAEAMREACARYIEGEDEMFADNGIRALPIPEDK